MHYTRYDVLYGYVLSRLQYWSEQVHRDDEKLLQQLLNAGNKERSAAKKYSATAGITLIAGIILAVFDFSNKYYQITEVLFGVALLKDFAIYEYRARSGKTLRGQVYGSLSRAGEGI